MAPQVSTNCPVPTLAGQPVRITAHALDRFAERVDPGASRQQAFGAIRQLLAYGIVRATPRWWTTARREPGTRFVYSDLDRDICLVLSGDAITTVLTATSASRRPWRWCGGFPARGHVRMSTSGTGMSSHCSRPTSPSPRTWRRWPEMASAREACEIHGLVVLQDYLTAARAGAEFDSLGPLLALSLVGVAGGMTGAPLFGTIECLATAMRASHRCEAAREFLRGAARGFAKSGDHQCLADTIELANVTRSGGPSIN